MNIYKFFRPLIFQLDPELAHNLAINFIKNNPVKPCNKEYGNLSQKIWDIDFKNPVGLAAGFDKNAKIPQELSKLGFGFVECGTVTPKPQSGNEKPRIFRLEKDEALINRLGFNNSGSEIFLKNILSLSQMPCPIGVNIGKNRDSEDSVLDYVLLLKKFYEHTSYITVNISSPNTQSLRDLQKSGFLPNFLHEIMKEKKILLTKTKKNIPILLKIAPDLTELEQEVVAEVSLKYGVDGLIISNTTISRDNLLSENKNQQGGLSGAPLFAKSNQVLSNIYKLTNGKIPIIGVGGVKSAEDVYKKIKLGASLVQIYSAFIYQGFGLLDQIKKELNRQVEKDGFSNIAEAVGAENYRTKT